jgi:hypothetical protein
MEDTHLRHYEYVERPEASHQSFSVTACGIVIFENIKTSISTTLVTCKKCKEHTEHNEENQWQQKAEKEQK